MNPKLLFRDGGRYSGLAMLDFGIKQGDKVLDIGAGHKPFLLATHIIDLPDEMAQRHFQPVRPEGRILLPGYAKDVLRQFTDSYFDFCYSSHTFEHIVDLPETIEEINRTCKRGFFALPGSDFEFLTAKSHFGHVNLCRLIGGVLHIARRPKCSIIDEFGRLFESELFENPAFNALWEGHGCRGFRHVWEIRHCWENRIRYKVCDPVELFPQLEYFEEP